MTSSSKRSEVEEHGEPSERGPEGGAPAEYAEGSRAEYAEGSRAEYAEGSVVAGKYRLTSVLGKGGMGAVWLARNLALDVDVAIKLIRRNADSEEASKRLLQEARTAARLGHPSIVRIFDFGETEQGDPFIVMEVLTGPSLRINLHKSGRLEVEDAVRTLLPVASGLIVAHAKGIVHRDLKPDNIILFTDDTNRVVPKIVDFGIAKLRVEDLARHVTSDGAILGSPDYMSPEQAIGRADIDHSTDIWAFSITLYECITGSRPFDGRNYNALIAAIRDDAPAPIMDFAAGDEELWAIIARGLEKTPANRWPGMREYGIALAEWARSQGVDNDISGTSIEAQWLSATAHLPRALPRQSSAPVGKTTTGGGARKSSGARLKTGQHHAVAPPRRWAVPVAIVAGGAVVALLAWTIGSRHGAPSTAVPASDPSSTISAAIVPSASAAPIASALSPSSPSPEPSLSASAVGVASALIAPRQGRLPSKPPAVPSAGKKKPDVGF